MSKTNDSNIDLLKSNKSHSSYNEISLSDLNRREDKSADLYSCNKSKSSSDAISQTGLNKTSEITILTKTSLEESEEVLSKDQNNVCNDMDKKTKGYKNVKEKHKLRARSGGKNDENDKKRDKGSKKPENAEDSQLNEETVDIEEIVKKTLAEIRHQNGKLKEIKCCLVNCTNMEEHCKLKELYQTEEEKLHSLILKIVVLQRKAPMYSWSAISIATNLSEDLKIPECFHFLYNARSLMPLKQMIAMKCREEFPHIQSDTNCNFDPEESVDSMNPYDPTYAVDPMCTVNSYSNVANVLIAQLERRVNCIEKQFEKIRGLEDKIFTLCPEKESKSHDSKPKQRKRQAAGSDNIESVSDSDRSNDTEKMMRKMEANCREKLSKLLEEQQQFKCILQEQSIQLEEYRQRYVKSQEIIEEQQCTIKQLENTNSKIEDQINMEMQKIKSKFQDKIKELVVYPKLFANEKSKFVKCCKERDEIAQRYLIISNELKNANEKLEAVKGNEKCCRELEDLKQELDAMKLSAELVSKEKAEMTEKFRKVSDELSNLRSETAVILSRSKERSELQKVGLKERISQLERDLATSRAQANYRLREREKQLKEARCQLQAALSSAETTRAEIKTLKSHVRFLSDKLSSMAPYDVVNFPIY